MTAPRRLPVIDSNGTAGARETANLILALRRMAIELNERLTAVEVSTTLASTRSTEMRGSPPNNEFFNIASGASTSQAIDLQGGTLKRLILPAVLSGTHLVFLAGYKSTEMHDVYDDSGTLIAVPFTQNRLIEFNPNLFEGSAFLQIKTASSTAGTGAVQAGARTLVGVIV